MELRDQIQETLANDEFQSSWKQALPIEGWMTDGQGALLWIQAAALDAGDRIVEIGSYRGRSLSMLATAAPDGVEIVAIDPHAGNDRGPQQWEGTADEGQSDNDLFWANLTAAGVAERITHVREFSQKAHDAVDGPINFLYVDGAHGYGPARDDLRDWGARVSPGGVMAVHDCYSSIGVTLALLRILTFSRQWTYLGRSRSLAAWRHTPVAPRAWPANVGRQVASLGWFARNVVVKALIVAKLKPVARLLGSDGESWPF
ncbi:MAG: class I SAM-dependent methyltransferase [Acidimicrobiales bacterium]